MADENDNSPKAMTKLSTIGLINRIPLFKSNRHYRVGDLVLQKDNRWQLDSDIVAKKSEFSGSILQEYFSSLSGTKADFKLLNKIIDNYIERKQIQIANDSEVVIHLRAGDSLAKSKHDATHAPKVYNTLNALEVIEQIDSKFDTPPYKIILTVAMNFSDDDLTSMYQFEKWKLVVNRKLIANFISELQQTYPTTEIQLFSDGSLSVIECVDYDLCLLSRSKNVITDFGGFSGVVKRLQRSHQMQQSDGSDPPELQLQKMVRRAESQFSKKGHRLTQSLFDDAYEFAKQHDLNLSASWTRRCSKATYITISPKGSTFCYVPIPKCGSSTIKKWIMECELTQKKVPGIHQSLETTKNPHGHTGYQSQFDLSEYQNHIKFVVIRDPILRFISFYYYFKNLDRPHAHRSRKYYSNALIDLDTFIDFFLSNPVKDAFVFNHSVSQSRFIGESLELFDRVFKIEQLSELREFLEAQFQMAIPSLRENRSKRKEYTIKQKSIEKLVEHFRDDYRLLADYYNPEKTIEKLINQGLIK